MEDCPGRFPALVMRLPRRLEQTRGHLTTLIAQHLGNRLVPTFRTHLEKLDAKFTYPLTLSNQDLLSLSFNDYSRKRKNTSGKIQTNVLIEMNLVKWEESVIL